jgi:hypothetical protein
MLLPRTLSIVMQRNAARSSKVSYSKRLNLMWMMPSEEFVQEAVQNKSWNIIENVAFASTVLELTKNQESMRNTVSGDRQVSGERFSRIRSTPD